MYVRKEIKEMSRCWVFRCGRITRRKITFTLVTEQLTALHFRVYTRVEYNRIATAYYGSNNRIDYPRV